MTKNIHIGTAGWSYKDWCPAFYPKSQSKQFDWLQYYANYFNCVEVNSSYYSYIALSTAEQWIKKIDHIDDFVFTIKLHQDFTHLKNYNAEKVKQTEKIFQLLKNYERFGGILFQFPYSFYFNSNNLRYLYQLSEHFSGYKRIVEVRHASWLNNDAIHFFSENDLSFCLIDQPEITNVININPILTTKTLYLRLHGRNKNEWQNSIKSFGQKQTYQEQNARYNYLYSLSELIEIETKIKESLEQAEEIFVITNNHPQGNAVVNALEFKYLLNEREKIVVPQTLQNVFNRLNLIG
jgi:uncharacterized protein YecE (DUF72 family)